MATETKAKRAEREEAIAKLRALLPPGSEVPTILRHVSRSGIQRSISPIIDGHDYSWLVARALGEKVDQKNGGVKMGGCGMDMGFALVHNLSYALYREGYNCCGDSERPSKRCPSSDHVNPGPDRSNYAADRVHKDGYALRQRWL